MPSDRGAALLLTLMILSFLAILGGALLTNSILDTSIGMNYDTSTQLLYMAEAGLEDARHILRVSPSTLSAQLLAAAGTSGSLSTATDLELLLASGNRPIVAVSPFRDLTGREVGEYRVWLRNDPADGVAATVDTNEIVQLLAIATMRSSRKTIEMMIRKARFPRIPAALALDGDAALFAIPSGGIFRIAGEDAAGGIPIDATGFYGGGAASALASMLQTPKSLEALISRMKRSANEVYVPASETAQLIGDYGDPRDYRLAVIDGDCVLGPGTGFGILVVRGELRFTGNFAWSGLIAVVGQGVMHWNADARGEIRGSLLVAKTRGLRTPADSLGPLLAARGSIVADFSGAGGPGIQYDSAAIRSANAHLPFTPIAVQED